MLIEDEVGEAPEVTAQRVAEQAEEAKLQKARDEYDARTRKAVAAARAANAAATAATSAAFAATRQRQIENDLVARQQRLEREAGWTFPQLVTTTAPIDVKLAYGTAKIPLGTKVKATESVEGLVRIEYSGTTALVPPNTVGLKPLK